MAKTITEEHFKDIMQSLLDIEPSFDYVRFAEGRQDPGSPYDRGVQEGYKQMKIYIKAALLEELMRRG